jgi:hypothetical protein
MSGTDIKVVIDTAELCPSPTYIYGFPADKSTQGAGYPTNQRISKGTLPNPL